MADTRIETDAIRPADRYMSQSSNDCFPAAMHIAAAEEITHRLIRPLDHLQEALVGNSRRFADIAKVGPTDMQDATRLTLRQEFSRCAAQVVSGIRIVTQSLNAFCRLAQGGTAVGTGLNSHPKFAMLFTDKVSKITALPFVTAPNKFEALASQDAYVAVHGVLSSIATGLLKIANHIRLLGSGRRSGLGELILPENEPGSSIMPGKVNPTQCVAMTMACCQLFGNDATRGGAIANAYGPLPR